MNRFNQMQRDLQVLKMIVIENLRPDEVATRLRIKPSQIEKIFSELETAVGSEIFEKPVASQRTPNALGKEIAERAMPIIDLLDALLGTIADKEEPEYLPASFDTEISARRITSEFFRLPFEVCFGLIVPVDYEPLYLRKNNIVPTSWKDCKFIKRSYYKAFDAWFRCDVNGGSELREIICNDIGDFVPPWLKYIGEGFAKGWSEDVYGMRVENVEIELFNIGTFVGDNDEYSEETEITHDCTSDIAEEFLGLGTSCTEYEIVSGPTFLILDAEGSRVKVTADGWVVPARAFRISEVKEMAFPYPMTSRVRTLFDRLSAIYCPKSAS